MGEIDERRSAEGRMERLLVSRATRRRRSL